MFPQPQHPQDKCEHRWSALGFAIVKTTDTSIEAAASIFCEVCGMFRTKILNFRRELGQTETPQTP